MNLIPSLLPFEKIPVTLVVLGCYLAAIISTLVVQEHLPSAPHDHHKIGLDLDEAWRDLQAIAQVAHPFNSRENDDVGRYLVKRLKQFTKGNSHITLDFDTKTNASWYSEDQSVTYMESRNIVIKFDGSKWNDSAVLLTAHYDTSSLAPGATDDSLAVVSLLQVAEQLTKHRPERSMILLFNNGEEDGLHGAQVFLRHPWMSLVQSFINVEGAGAGGRPNLFRSSSAQITYAFRKAAHPHGSSLFSDAFKLGLIRSTTDYSIYTRAGIPGSDYAFYTGRQKYHTMSDTVASLHNRHPLWIMMENLHNVVKELAYQPDIGISDNARFVYFDVFGEGWFYMRSDLFMVFNILLIVLGPIFVILLGWSLHRSHKLYVGLRGWGRFPVALILGVLVAGVCIGWYGEYNPMVIDRAPYSILVTIACFTALATLVPMYITDWWKPTPSQRAQVLLEMFGLWWIVSIITVIVSARRELTGTYLVTFFYAATLAATLISLLDMHRLDRKVPIAVPESAIPHDQEADASRNGADHHIRRHHQAGDVESTSDERTPLIPRAEELLVVANQRTGQQSLGWIWVLEFILLAVFPAILMLQLTFSLLAALGPTVVDGTPPAFVYALISLSVMLAILPIAPFAHKLPVTFYLVLLVIGIATAAYTSFVFPFTSESPLKVFFGQTVDLDQGNSTVTLAGVRPYLDRVFRELPTIDSSNITWSKGPVSGIQIAGFPGLAPRSVPNTPMADWVHVTLNKTSLSSASITVMGNNTRACRVSFEGGYNVAQAVVRGSNTKDLQLPSPHPLKQVNLWSRTWNATWVVDVDFMAPSTEEQSMQSATAAKVLSGKVSCIWSERTNGRIPALDELYVFFPMWATISAGRAGLVEGWKSFSV
ncbi:Vacuolar membrane protease {ECO:0000250/UniProtKB:P38244} {ECO:0000305}; AltName: Full=FXNA-related family protease 1 {ECO:0000250/UniProtKB:P38244} [Serendipita indica DSM 11827]|nr:Vacuolar membrane protease {ECO:0000250/UniProtKB:P38244} {ECO:0000305}; AltName: Full=FXNA-related family protease 1 {ECO:0000250/UniProtKB:P38244} [Serendipita indica DSM 11827]